ncbi:MAG: heparan-alpha-glucosaminide N-acetyltransferase [Chloroflexota bacterium]|nr:heparan-alpha-glucosaminide N-acetyltransferase [Chloroflexota bacterium]
MTALSTYFTGMRASITPVRQARGDRLWEIDLLRGIAIMMMVIYHLVFDLYAFGSYPIDLFGPFWKTWQNITASLFLGLVGLSLTLSYNAARQGGGSGNLFGKYLIRGLQVFSWGMLITLVTFFVNPAVFVRFGILHLIGVSIIISYPLLRFKWLNLFLGIAILVLGQLLPVLNPNISWLGWLGLDQSPGAVFDWAPIIPWYARVVLGILIGNTLYAGGERHFPLPDLSQNVLVRGLRLMGQNSLLIYLIHQPILIVLLTLTGMISLF